MFRAQLPRLYELKALTPDRDSPCSYFKDFETKLQTLPHAYPWYLSLEKKMQYLHEDAWNALKIEASQYLTRKESHPGRCKPDPGWRQLFDILCQADAYRYLRDLGCSGVCLIPKASKKGQKTPDLEGLLGAQRVLCEVKRINVSDLERLARDNNMGGTYEGQLSDGFFKQVQAAIGRAKDQICAYDPQGRTRQIVYISISFDEGAGFNRADELRQVKQYLNNNPAGIEVGYSAWN